MLEWGEDRHELQNPGGCECGAVRRQGYRTVRLGAAAKFTILHSKIGRRVDFARVTQVRYYAMVAEVGGYLVL
jgi:hypothetical protein